MPGTEKILVVKNIAREGCGLFSDLMAEMGVPLEVAELEHGQVFPPPQGFAAVIVLGGPDSANDTMPKMMQELKRIRECLSLRIPYLGICLGLQTLVKAAGGAVVKSSVKEVGFRGPDGKFFEISLTQAGREDPLFAGFEERFHVFQLHGETVHLQPSMMLLGEGRFCQNQIVKIGDCAYGLQFHFEITPELLRCWHQEDGDLKQMDGRQLENDLVLLGEKYVKNARRFFINFLQLAGVCKGVER